MIRLHITVSSHKKILSLPSNLANLARVTELIKEEFAFASLPMHILIQYWFEEEDFSEWVDLDEDTIKTFEDQKIYKLKVFPQEKLDASSSRSSPKTSPSQQPQTDDVHQTASTSQPSIRVPASHSAPSDFGSQGGGKDQAPAFPAKYRISIQDLPHGLQMKQEKCLPLDQQDMQQLLAYIYYHVTTHYEDVFYPTSEQYINMADAVLTTFPAVLKNSDLEKHEMQLQWKLRIQRKFQNSRKRQDSSVTEVMVKKKKVQHLAREETDGPLMYGVKAYLPPRPASEDDESLERHRQWLAKEWSKRDPDLPNVERLMKLTLCERRKKIVCYGSVSVSGIIDMYPWIQNFDGVIKEFLRLEPNTEEPDPRVSILQGLKKYRHAVVALLKKRRSLPQYLKAMLDIYRPNETKYACLVLLGILHLLGERKESIFTKVSKEQLGTTQSSITIQHVGEIGMANQFCVMMDGTRIAETACIAMAVAALVAGLFVFNIDHPKNCEHFSCFISCHLLGVNYDEGDTAKCKSLRVKLDEMKMMSHENV